MSHLIFHNTKRWPELPIDLHLNPFQKVADWQPAATSQINAAGQRLAEFMVAHSLEMFTLRVKQKLEKFPVPQDSPHCSATVNSCISVTYHPFQSVRFWSLLVVLEKLCTYQPNSYHIGICHQMPKDLYVDNHSCHPLKSWPSWPQECTTGNALAPRTIHHGCLGGGFQRSKTLLSILPGGQLTAHFHS